MITTLTFLLQCALDRTLHDERLVQRPQQQVRQDVRQDEHHRREVNRCHERVHRLPKHERRRTPPCQVQEHEHCQNALVDRVELVEPVAERRVVQLRHIVR